MTETQTRRMLVSILALVVIGGGFTIGGISATQWWDQQQESLEAKYLELRSLEAATGTVSEVAAETERLRGMIEISRDPEPVTLLTASRAATDAAAASGASAARVTSGESQGGRFVEVVASGSTLSLVLMLEYLHEQHTDLQVPYTSIDASSAPAVLRLRIAHE